jgi:uridine kinase
MKGDKIHLEQYHLEIAYHIAKSIEDEINRSHERYCIAIAGESGSGKSVSATALKTELEALGINSIIIQQDDYFFLPPKTNEMRRRESFKFVGTHEVNLDLIDTHLKLLKNGADTITKPLVIFNENRAEEETLDVENCKVILVEGTYISLLKSADKRIFIDRDRQSSIESIKKRARDIVDDFLVEVLTIEHNIISEHKKFADIVIKEGVNIEFIKR